jgi:hypothetical protein
MRKPLLSLGSKSVSTSLADICARSKLAAFIGKMFLFSLPDLKQNYHAAVRMSIDVFMRSPALLRKVSRGLVYNGCPKQVRTKKSEAGIQSIRRNDARAEKEINSLLPIWFQLPRSFYVRLYQTAKDCGLSPAAVLKEGVKLVSEKHERKAEQQLPADIDQSQAASVLASKQWKKITPEERRERASALAKKRWGSKSTD